MLTSINVFQTSDRIGGNPLRALTEYFRHDLGSTASAAEGLAVSATVHEACPPARFGGKLLLYVNHV